METNMLMKIMKPLDTINSVTIYKTTELSGHLENWNGSDARLSQFQTCKNVMKKQPATLVFVNCMRIQTSNWSWKIMYQPSQAAHSRFICNWLATELNML